MTGAIYAAAALAEIAGCFAFWAWLRNGRSALWLAPGAASLILFALLLKRLTIGGLSDALPDPAPLPLAVQDIGAPELESRRIVRPEPLRDCVQPARKPMGLPFEDREAGEHDVAVVRVLDRTGIVQIKEIHRNEDLNKKGSQEGRTPAVGSCRPPNCAFTVARDRVENKLRKSVSRTAVNFALAQAITFVLAALAEIAGCFAFWAWLRNGRSALWLAPGAASLILFALLLTRIDAGAAGRAFAAYGGVYIAASLAWLWLVEGVRPDRWDLAGAALCVAGAVLIIAGPRGV